MTMQHQYWVTKKTVLKKLGTKEDDCVVSSDAELDAKLDLFGSISDSCLQLQRVLDQYQQRLCVLAQEENNLGKFLRDAGKGSDVSGKHMISAGKAISYSGQQRLSVRGPLVRLYHEVETFRERAVKDMRATVSAMEKARIEYRAALSWMKSTSAQLDPDTGRGLDNFRKAQRQVRESKKLFDKLTLDVLQKIDLLAAARCNMFSHVLCNYQSSFLNFSNRVAQTLTSSADSMSSAPQYEFCILKELSQTVEESEAKQADVVPQDKDQMLFFQDEFKDDAMPNNAPATEKTTDNKPLSPSKLTKTGTESATANLIDTLCQETIGAAEGSGAVSELAGLRMDCGDMQANFGSFMPSQLLQKHIHPGKEHIADMKHKRSTKSAVYEHTLDRSNHYIRFDKAQILSKEPRFLPRMIREAIEIKKHPNFNRDDGWSVPPAWDPIIRIIKSQARHHTGRQKPDTDFNSTYNWEETLSPSVINQQQSPQLPRTPSSSSTVPKKDDKAAWFKLFAELDPLANPDNLPGSNTNQSHAA